MKTLLVLLALFSTTVNAEMVIEKKSINFNTEMIKVLDEEYGTVCYILNSPSSEEFYCKDIEVVEE